MGVLKYAFLTFIMVVETEAWTRLFAARTQRKDNWVTPMSFTEIPFSKTATEQAMHITTMSSASTKSSEDCFTDSTTTYGGKQYTTMSNHTCLRWDSSLIPIDERFKDTDFPMDGTVQQANNYCRDPNNSGNLWCYTTNPEVKTDKCLILKCEGIAESTVLAQFEDDVWKCRYPTKDCMEDEQLVCNDTVYTTTIKGDCKLHLCCYKRGCIDVPNVPSSDYAGRWSHSLYNIECLRWDTITYIPLSGSSFPEGSIADANNYCRDPDNKEYSHDCYTPTESDKIRTGRDVTEKDVCLVDPDRIFIDSDELRAKYPGCQECSCCQIQKCYMGATENYEGTWSRTVSGRECRSWTETEYTSYPAFFFFYGSTPWNSENYCRDFFGVGYAYCRPKDRSMGDEVCNLKIECPGSALKTTPKQNRWPFSFFLSQASTSQVPQETTYQRETTTMKDYITYEIPVQTVKPTTNRKVSPPSVEQTSVLSVYKTRSVDEPVGAYENTTRSVDQSSEVYENKTPSMDQTSEVYERETRSVDQPLEASKTPLVDQTSEVYERKTLSVDQPLEASKTPSMDKTSEVYERKTRSVDQPLEVSKTPSMDQTSKVYERKTRSVDQSSEVYENKTPSVHQTSKVYDRKTRLVYQTFKTYVGTTSSGDQISEVYDSKTYESRQATSAPLTENASSPYEGKSISTDIALLTTRVYTLDSTFEQNGTALQPSKAPAKRITIGALFFIIFTTFILIHGCM